MDEGIVSTTKQVKIQCVDAPNFVGTITNQTGKDRIKQDKISWLRQNDVMIGFKLYLWPAGSGWTVIILK